MDQTNQGENSSGLSVRPVKRRRGRPHKDPNLNHSGAALVPPGFEQMKGYLPHRADKTNGNDCMVGQAVTGVIEATFDAGYLLTVRIGNSPTNLRGVVFKPGHYVPVTRENDVVPHLQMIRRDDIHFPAENQGCSRSQKLPIQPTGMVPAKQKHAPPKVAPSVPPVGVRGTVVPVVLQPVNHPNGSNQMPSDASQSASMMAFGDKDVHMAEPLSMLPPDGSIPVNILGTEPHSSHQISLGSQQNDSKPFNEGNSMVGQGENVKSTESTDADNSSETSDSQTENDKEPSKSSAENSGIVSKLEAGNTSEPISTMFVPTTVTKPLFNYGTGRMTELLQAVQENVKENPAQIAEQPPTASKFEIQANSDRN